MEIWKPKHCNCLIWSLVMKFKYQGKIMWRWSYLGPWPHFFWSPDGETIYEYSPIECNGIHLLLKNKAHWVRKLYFKGAVQVVLSEKIEKEVIRGSEKVKITLDVIVDIINKLKAK